MPHRSILAYLIAAYAVALALAPVVRTFLVPPEGQASSAGRTSTTAQLSRSLRSTPLVQMEAAPELAALDSTGGSPVLLAGGAVALLGLAAVALSLNSDGDKQPASIPASTPAPAEPAEPEPVVEEAPVEEPAAVEEAALRAEKAEEPVAMEPAVVEEAAPVAVEAEEAPLEPVTPSTPVAQAPVAASDGETVSWKGKLAAVRFRGSVKFAPGEWVGLELEGGGMHNGTVLGVKYFECPAGTGVFCLASEVVEAGAPEPAPAQPAPAPAAAAEPAPAPAEPETPAAPAPEAPAPQPAAPAGPVTEGSEVTWNGQPAVVRFMGKVKFAVGEWVGLELLEGKGMHNGTVLGVSYFKAAPFMGVFCQASQLEAALVPAPAAPAPVPAAPMEPAATGAAPAATTSPPAPAEPLKMEVGAKVVFGEIAGRVKYIGPAKFAKGEWIGVELDGPGGMHDGKVMGTQYFECPAGRGVFCQASQLKVTEAA
eukprot:CAMPEP_0171065078 /NCGR_PEP_ID=MMETSP0766_2-20121228/6643_1 /TAXON_ID=439317 /ORGANISM="Gambierdiscus australes, Strain CAWD 149" /LENGTH=481 /DNA_ID=CAMNT_0011521151 /DNA_START=60 /DNA_END=1505 /DNA_ORIENTATION=+